MSKLNNVEKIEKVLFQSSSNFTIKNTIIVASKGQENRKRNSVYAKTYNSTKYSDRNQLSSIHIKTSDFIVLAYNNFEEKVNEEVYISYPHMVGFVNLLNDAISVIEDNRYWTENDVTDKNFYLQSQSLGGGKTIIFLPQMFQDEQNNFFRGMYLILNNDNIMIPLDMNAMYTLQYIINNINLMELSSNTLLTGMLFDGGASSNSYNNTSNTPSSSSRNNGFSSNGNRQSFFGGNNNGTINNNRRATTSQPSGFKPTVTPTRPAPVVPPTPTPQTETMSDQEVFQTEVNVPPLNVPAENKGDGKIKMNDILSQAEDISLDEIDV